MSDAFVAGRPSSCSGAIYAGVPKRPWPVESETPSSDASNCRASPKSDFGLALQLLASDEGVSLSTGQGLLGTPAYMAPEQLEGRPATNASDIYALGLVIYEMLTGERAFVGANLLSSAFKRLSDPPRPPRNFAPDLSPACESIILRCLARNPADRFASARDVATALAENLPQPVTASTIGPHSITAPLVAARTTRSTIARISGALILLALAAAECTSGGLCTQPCSHS